MPPLDDLPPPPPDDDVPMPDGPPAWLDELEASRPDPEPGEATGPSAGLAAPRRAAKPAEARPVASSDGPVLEDPALKLAVELFNGRVVAAPEES
jgi:hypothetical protein